MGDIHQLHTSAGSQARLLELWITEITSKHPDKAVAKRWTELARGTAQKFPGPPLPNRTQIELDQLNQLPADDKQQVVNEIEQFITSYMNDVRSQLMDVHRELLSLQKNVAELEQERVD